MKTTTTTRPPRLARYRPRTKFARSLVAALAAAGMSSARDVVVAFSGFGERITARAVSNWLHGPGLPFPRQLVTLRAVFPCAKLELPQDARGSKHGENVERAVALWGELAIGDGPSARQAEALATALDLAERRGAQRARPRRRNRVPAPK